MIGFLVWLACVSLPYSAPLPFREEPSLPLPHRPQGEAISVDKRIFLSRGWGPGGYEVPSEGVGNSEEVVRLARLLRKEGNPSIASLMAPTLRPSLSNDGSWKSSAKSFREKQLQEPQDYRRFHSIFTSGTWSPLGKRSGFYQPLLRIDDDPYEDLSGQGYLMEEPFSPPPKSEFFLPPLFSIPDPRTKTGLKVAQETSFPK